MLTKSEDWVILILLKNSYASCYLKEKRTRSIKPVSEFMGLPTFPSRPEIHSSAAAESINVTKPKPFDFGLSDALSSTMKAEIQGDDIIIHTK